MSLALRTMSIYFTTDINVKVQNIKEKTPNISVSLSDIFEMPESELLNTYKGEILRSPYTMPKLWYAKVKVVLHEFICNMRNNSVVFNKKGTYMSHLSYTFEL